MWSVADFARIQTPNDLREMMQAIGNIADSGNDAMGDALDLQMDLGTIDDQVASAVAEFGPQVTMWGVPNFPSLLAHIPIGKSRDIAEVAAQQLALGRWALKRIQIPLLNLENAFRDNGFNAEATQVGVTNNIIDDMYRVTRDRVGDFPPFLERYNEIKKDFKWNIDFMQSAHPAHIPSKVDQNGSPLDGEGNAKYWELVSDMIGTFGLEGGHTSSDAKAILKGAGIGELGNPLGFWGFMALMAKIAATIAVALIIADTIKPLLAAYATAAEATRKLQERISQRQDQMDEEIDRENENLEEEESAIDADPSLTPAQKQTRKEDARDKHRGRVDVIKKKNDDANDKDRRDTEKDIETLGEHSPLGDLKALIIPAAALLVGGLVITKL